MNDYAELSEQVIRFSCVKFILLFASLVTLMCLCVYLNPEGWGQAAWAYWFFGGMALLVAHAFALQYFLCLSPKGLTIHNISSRRDYSWDKVRNFRVAARPDDNNVPDGE